MRYLLHDVFINSVKKYPKNIAIKTEKGDTITYSELNRLSNKFANFFKEKKSSIIEMPYVGILGSVSIPSIASVLGTLKIGATYIPLDEYSPFERLSHIVKSTKLETLVMEDHWLKFHKDLLNLPEIKNIVVIGQKQEVSFPKNERYHSMDSILKSDSSEPPLINQVSDDLAYILHSSGSTGIPKGIMLTHRNARTFVDWMQKEFKLTEKDIVISRAPFKFDLSVFDIFNTLAAGATLICFDWTQKRRGDEKHSDYVSLMEKEKVTIIYTTPSTYITLLNRGNLSKAKLSLREIMYAGEPFPTPQLRKLKKVLEDVKIANIYGPTETNIITYYWVDNIPKDNSPIPLGSVVDDTEIIIVSEDSSHICKAYEKGEIWCRGGTVTIGYLGQKEKTDECLIESPFHKYPVYFWRTGDYGYRDSKNCIHYIGRKDHMVKVKSFRIELGEIEATVATFPDLDEFSVVAIPDDKYGNKLYCYYTTLKPINTKEMKLHLKRKLPEYMIPYKFIHLKIMPKTSSGKIDRLYLTKKAK